MDSTQGPKGRHQHGPECDHDHSGESAPNSEKGMKAHSPSHSHAGGGHHHHHHHHHASGRVGWAFFLNLLFAVIELVGGILTNSMAILSDALHDFGDAAALGVAYFLEKKSNREHDLDYTYGYRRLSVLSALITGVILVAGAVTILALSVSRFQNPRNVSVEGMLGLAFLGIAVNGFAAWKLSRGTSLNERMVTWHLVEDVLGWIIVLIGAIVIYFTGWTWVDPTLAVLLSLWVGWNVVKGLRHSLRVFLQAGPEGLKREDLLTALKNHDQVMDVHHLHLWTLDGEKHILTAHLVLQPQTKAEETFKIKADLKKRLREDFAITEATLEVEWDADNCADPSHQN